MSWRSWGWSGDGLCQTERTWWRGLILIQTTDWNRKPQHLLPFKSNLIIAEIKGLNWSEMNWTIFFIVFFKVWIGLVAFQRGWLFIFRFLFFSNQFAFNHCLIIYHYSPNNSLLYFNFWEMIFFASKLNNIFMY